MCCAQWSRGQIGHRLRSSCWLGLLGAQSQAQEHPATGFTHLAGRLPVPWVPNPKHKKIMGEATKSSVHGQATGFTRLAGWLPVNQSPSPRHKKILGEATMSSVHSGAEIREATAFTHFACWLSVPGGEKTRLMRRRLLCTAGQRQGRPQASLLLLAGCQSLGCPAQCTTKSLLR